MMVSKKSKAKRKALSLLLGLGAIFFVASSFCNLAYSSSPKNLSAMKNLKEVRVTDFFGVNFSNKKTLTTVNSGQIVNANVLPYRTSEKPNATISRLKQSDTFSVNEFFATGSQYEGNRISTPLVANQSNKPLIKANEKSENPAFSRSLDVSAEIASLNSEQMFTESQLLAISKNSSAAENTTATQDDSLEFGREEANLVYSDIPASDFVSKRQSIQRTTLRVRLVDDRSSTDLKKIYPLSRLHVKIIDDKINGLNFSTFSDALGFVEIPNVPLGSDILLQINDPMDRRVRRSVHSLVVRNNKPLVLKLMRKEVADITESAAENTFDSKNSTLCGEIVKSKNEYIPMSGVQLAIDNKPAFYLNDYGILDKKLGATSSTGKFCFFQVKPGPISVHAFSGGEHHSTYTLSAFAGATNLVTLEFDVEPKVSTWLSMSSSAHEQFGSDSAAADSLKLVDSIEVVPFGAGSAMNIGENGELVAENEIALYQGKAYVMAQAPEFENAIYEIGSRKAITLLPRGFIDDMAAYANVVQDNDLGSLVVEHFSFSEQTEGAQLRLVDATGTKIDTGSYYSDFPRTKAVYFNLLPGTYQLYIETRQGDLLTTKTVNIYSESPTHVATGSDLELTHL